jgi:hypothetical protein
MAQRLPHESACARRERRKATVCARPCTVSVEDQDGSQGRGDARSGRVRSILR